MDLEKIIQMKNVYKSYDGKTNVLDNLSLTVNKGEYIVIKGKSGSGKSTLLNIMGLLDKHTTGNYFFCNKEIKLKTTEKYDILRGENIGFIFQAYNLIEHYTVKDNILLPYLYSRKRLTKALINEAEQLIEELELSGFASTQVEYLSGGQKQRCAIARAILGKKNVIIADEPTGNLDYENSKIVSNQFKKLANNNTTIVVVTHNESVFNNADVIYDLKGGRLYNSDDI